jgi:hypothetical protein
VFKSPEALLLDVPPLRQPDDVSCGPTCLFKVLRGYGDPRSFDEIATAVRRNDDGGTLGVFVGLAALALGYEATIYSYNLRVYDPTWSHLTSAQLADKLSQRARAIAESAANNAGELKLSQAVDAYARFVREGGQVLFDDLTDELLVSLLDTGRPIVCGLSATYLYQTPREDPRTGTIDDVGGEPAGHFLVVCGYRQHGRHFVVSDPYRHLPMTVTGTYEVGARRLINAILLGDVSYDGVLVVVSPRNTQ